jgi:hypothetical protein
VIYKAMIRVLDGTISVCAVGLQRNLLLFDLQRNIDLVFMLTAMCIIV